MESFITVTLREILCGSLSLDDGLSAIQNAAIVRSEDSDIVFEIARTIEEILLRRPSIANAKLLELIVRLSFRKDRAIPEMLMLLDTRFTCNHRRSETEFLPDIDAIPQLLDILGELSQAMDSARRMNLRPLLPFLTDETLTTLNSIADRGHETSTVLALHEVHYLADILTDTGFFEGAELLLNRILSISREMDLHEFVFEASISYSSVLTELGLYEESRALLKRMQADLSPDDLPNQAAVKLLMAINETRDDEAPYETARDYGNEAISLHEKGVMSGELRLEDLGLAHLVIGSAILNNGWREALPQAVERLESSLRIMEGINEPDREVQSHLVKCLSGLGFAHGLIGGHEDITTGLEYLERAEAILNQLSLNGVPSDHEIAIVENAIGWICLSSESNEHWPRGIDGFKNTLRIRKKLLEQGVISELAILGSEVGYALSEMRRNDQSDPEILDKLRNVVARYIPLFPTDPRAFIDAAIAIYDIVWISYRHDDVLSSRLLRLLEDIDSMLDDARVDDESGFVDGVSLVVPYINSSWPLLMNRADRIKRATRPLVDSAVLMKGLATSKLNVESSNLDSSLRPITAIDKSVSGVDPLLAQYWHGQTQLTETVKEFYSNRNYTELAEGLFSSSLAFIKITNISIEHKDSIEFIKATSISLAAVLFHFANVLKDIYHIEFHDGSSEFTILDDAESRYDFILEEDWLNLMKITESYLQMIAQSESIHAQPYLNAVFSNISRALRMMDRVAMVDRRVLSKLGLDMNRRYYLRA